MNADPMVEIRARFAEEAGDLIRAYGVALEALEADPADGGSIDAAFRAVHTIKGGAATLGMSDLAAEAHALEDVLAPLRSGDGAWSAGTAQRLLRGGDAMLRSLDGCDPPAPSGGARPADRTHQSAPRPGASTQASYRIRVDRVERVAAHAADLSLREAALRRVLPARSSGDGLLLAAERMGQTTREMRRAVIALSAQPIDPLLARMATLARDTAAKLDRPLRVEVDGGAIELDAGLVERLVGPLTHLVRNAVDHGIEADRAAAGKPAEGMLALSARQAGELVTVEVRDDGQGLDPAALEAGARRLGREVPAGAAADHLLRLAALPGLSTRGEATSTSGRGVGLDAVMRDVAEIGGHLSLDTRPGQGACFAITLPTTIAVIDALVCRAGGLSVALPLATVAATRHRGDGAPNSPCADGPAERAIDLGQLLCGDPGRAAGPEIVQLAPPTAAALAVDQIEAFGLVTVRPLPRDVARAAWITGATVADDGHIGYVVDPGALVGAAP